MHTMYVSILNSIRLYPFIAILRNLARTAIMATHKIADRYHGRVQILTSLFLFGRFFVVGLSDAIYLLFEFTLVASERNG